eukprot:4446164-Ditylum_brightwellii.AAC.1
MSPTKFKALKFHPLSLSESNTLQVELSGLTPSQADIFLTEKYLETEEGMTEMDEDKQEPGGKDKSPSPNKDNEVDALDPNPTK